MSTELLVTLTVIEIVALVAVLALFVILITNRLRSIANALGQVSGNVIGAIQGDVFLIGAGAAILNRKLHAIGGLLPKLAAKAESLSLQQTQQTRAPARGAPAAQDPAVWRR
jgi:hypothetical protein